MRVLIVDDDPGIRSLFRVAMEDMEVLEAPGGAEALAILTSERVDVVVLDVMMPRMNGFQVLAQIRRNPQLRDLPVVMLTAKVGEADHVRGFRGGADAYMTKPFDIDALLSTVHEVHARGPKERERMRDHELGKAELLRQIEHSFNL